MGAVVIMAVISLRLAELVPLVGQLRPAMLSVLVLFPLLAWRSGIWNRRRVREDPIVVLLAAYALWAGLSVPFALWRGHAAGYITHIPIGMTVVIAIVLCSPTRANMDRLASWFLGLAVAAGVLSYVNGIQLGGRLTTSAAFDPNDLASLMAVALPFAVARILRGPPFVAVAGLLASGALVAVILATGSRGGMIALAVGLPVLLAGMNARRAMLGLLMVAIVSPLAWQVAPPTFQERLASMATLETDYNVTEEYGRLGTWKRGVGYALSNPVTGVGIGNFPIAEGDYYRNRNVPGMWLTAHNSFIQAFAELGFPGGLLFIALLVHGLRIALTFWRSHDHPRPEYLAAILAFCAAGFFLSHAYAYHLFALLGLIAHAGHVQLQPLRAQSEGYPRTRRRRTSRRAERQDTTK